ncbi:MAG: site-specific DNA-methyltransferase [Thermoplasmata archaeon]|nr:site-specific DNA-methyltransferase [Thermoplasmata archaeon]
MTEVEVDPSPTAPPSTAAVRDLIVRGDALEALRAMASESVHLAITSPPYNVGIAYAGYADDRGHAEYLAWLGRVWGELFRVLVPGGRFALNVAPTSIKAFRPIHHDLTRGLRDLGYIMRTEIIWYKQTMGRRTAWGSWRSPANPHIIPSWEYVLVFSKGSWRLPGAPADIDITAREFQDFSDGFWSIRPERRRKGHPAPFPEELIERLVKFYSYRGNTVLDMFGGTGTVAAVARTHGRHFLHVDASPEYCAVALERVRATKRPAHGPSIPAPRSVVAVTALEAGAGAATRAGRARSARPGSPTPSTPAGRSATSDAKAR